MCLWPWLVVVLVGLAGVQAGTPDAPKSWNLLLFPSSDCGSQAEILTIGVQLQRRGHQVTALVADGCAAEARQFLRSDKFLSPPSGTPLASTTYPGSLSCNYSSSSGDTGNKSKNGADGLVCTADDHEAEAACASAESLSEESQVIQDGDVDAAEAQQQQQQQQQQQEEELQREQEREAQRNAVLASINLHVYSGSVSLEEVVAAKALLHDEAMRMSLAHRTEYALANCGGLMANISIMMGLKDAGFDVVMGDLSDPCAWPLADALNVDARIDIDVSGSPAPPYLAYNMRYPLAYVPAEGSGLAGGTLTMGEKVKNLYYHIKLWWEKWRVLVPRVEAFRQQYAELHPGLLRTQQTQQAQQAQQVQQAQRMPQGPSAGPAAGMAGSANLAPTMAQQRQQQQRQALENELNAIRDVRLGTLLCIVTADWAFQEPYALPPLVKHVGPVLPGPAQPLPPALKAFLEAKGRRSITTRASADQGDPPPPPVVVVGSFKTGHYKLTRQAMVGLAEAFSELTLLRIVWYLTDVEQERLAAWYRPVTLARHVYITSHLPLNDLLGHPNVRAYMCDGSLPSMYHALWHGVPMLTVALNQEQESHVVRALRLGVARRLQRSHLEQGFGFMVEHALGRVSTGAAYRIRAAELSRRMRAANPSPAKAAAEAVEAALEAGTSTFLHSMEVFLPWWKVMMLDVCCAFLALLVLAVVLVWVCVKAAAKVAAWSKESEQETARSHVEEMKKFR